MPDRNQGLSAPQKQWFDTLAANLERETGRSLAEWAELGRACPETKHRARLAWMKATHGLGQNRASLVLHAAFPSAPAETDSLWSDPAAAAILHAVRAVAESLDEVVCGKRKSFTSFSRRYQFAAIRPLKPRGARLGLAVPVTAHPRLTPRGAESWSERLSASLDLPDAAAVDDGVAALLRQAWSTP